MALLLAKRLEPVLLVVGGTAYVYYLVLRLRKGLPRVFALLPLLLVSHLVAWRCPTPVERAMCCVSYLWCFVFKLLLLAWDKGGLVTSNFPRFLVSLLMDRLQQDPQFSHSKMRADLRTRDSKSDKVVVPTGHKKSPSHSKPEADLGGKDSKPEADLGGKDSKPEADLGRNDSKPEEIASLSGQEKSGAHGSEKKSISQATAVQADDETKKSPGWLWRMATSEALHVVLIRDLLFYIVITYLTWMLLTGKDVISVYLIDLSLGLLTYFSVSLLYDIGVVIPSSIVGKESEPVMDMPFLATSLGDFWGRRWNLVVINLGRVSVYEPILQFLSRGKERASLVDQAIASQAVFLVSGLMHELAIFYAIKTMPSLWMMTFFLVNGLGTLVERLVMKNLLHGSELPTFLKWAYTFAFLYFTGHWFFCPPCRAMLHVVSGLYAESGWAKSWAKM